MLSALSMHANHARLHFSPMDQLELGAYARRTDPDTSHEAASEVSGAKANALEAIVLKALRSYPEGLTNHEIVAVTGLTWNTASPRMRPMVRKHLVVDSGLRRKGPTNKNCVVWKAI